jgi:ribosome biogenesis protein NSA2
LDYYEKKRKKEGREAHDLSKKAKKKNGLKAKLYHKQCHAKKIQMKKTSKVNEKTNTKQKDDEKTPQGTVPAIPANLLDREKAKSKSIFQHG